MVFFCCSSAVRSALVPLGCLSVCALYLLPRSRLSSVLGAGLLIRRALCRRAGLGQTSSALLGMGMKLCLSASVFLLETSGCLGTYAMVFSVCVCLSF